jgi:hypothetical protein
MATLADRAGFIALDPPFPGNINTHLHHLRQKWGSLTCRSHTQFVSFLCLRVPLFLGYLPQYDTLSRNAQILADVNVAKQGNGMILQLLYQMLLGRCRGNGVVDLMWGECELDANHLRRK